MSSACLFNIFLFISSKGVRKKLKEKTIKQVALIDVWNRLWGWVVGRAYEIQKD